MHYCTLEGSDPRAHRWFGRLSITVSSRREVELVTLRGELDVAGAGALHQCLAGLTGPSIVVDVRRLAFIDAAGLSALVMGHARALRLDQAFVVRGAQGIVRRVLDVAGLDHLTDDVAP